MERLLSSPSTKPRPLLLPNFPRSRSLPLPPHLPAARSARVEGGRCSLSTSPDPRRAFVVRSSRKEEEEIDDYVATQSDGGCGFQQSFLRKVASAGLLALLSTAALSLIQQILVRPAFASFTPIASKTSETVARTELFSSAWTGFFAGCLHTLSGPDHLAALAPLSIGRTRVESAIVGALWGCGHDAGQVIFGLLFLVLKDRLHIEVLRTWGTRVVGLTLVAIGALGIREASEVPVPCVVLENGECDVSDMEPSEAVPIRKKKIGFATFATGIIHGLQPDALFMVLPALALPSRLAGAAFLGMFLVGTVVAMGSYTVFIGSFTEVLKGRIPRIAEKLTWASSLVAILMGLGVLVSQVFGFSLY